MGDVGPCHAHESAMTRWVLAGLLTVALWPADSIARDPYNLGFPSCKGGERGHWNTITREANEKKTVYLVLTTVDVADPAFVICWVDGKDRVMAIGPEKKA